MSKKNEQNQEVSRSLPEPVTEDAMRLRECVSPERWARMVREAEDKVRILHEVGSERDRTGDSWRRCLKRVAPEVTWSCYRHRWRRWQGRSGPEWERLLDRRVPPNVVIVVSPEIRAAIVALRQVDERMNCETARGHLIRQFQERGDLSDSTLRRIWSQAGLTRTGEGDASHFEKVEKFNGGGGLALIETAALETGTVEALGRAAQKEGRLNASLQTEPIPAREPEGRDERGRFTAEYNHLMRDDVEVGKADSRWNSDEWKRERRNLNGLTILDMKSETLSQHMMAIGLIPLVTERRGFDGLDGPKGQWLELTGLCAYQPSTLDKTLAELALLDVGDALWSQHGSDWSKKALQWGAGEMFWRRFVLYVDTTQEPYWTHYYASSGKVTRLGRVMPCLSRIMVAGGPGVPLLIETRPGTISLKTALPEIIREAEEAIGLGEIPRITIVDAEAASVKLLTELKNVQNFVFITVLKGAVAKGVKLQDPGPWEPYRERDSIRSGTVILQGKGAPEGGLKLHAVEMARQDGRHPHPTLFITCAEPESMTSAEIADLYLSRWPNQEQFFRNSRNGAGFARTHGYGGEYVTHVALETALEKAERRLVRAEKRLVEQKDQEKAIATLESCAKEPSQKEAAVKATKQAKIERKRAEKKLANAQEEYQELSTTPREIYKRDTTRENIVTVFSLTVMLLIEFVLREYFGKLKMELRTFIDQFLYAPTTVRTSHYRVIYQLESNPRNPVRTEQLRKACREVTRRKLRKDGRLVVFEVVDPPGQFP